MAEDPGFLLVQAGLVRDDELLTAREARAQGGGTLGEHLVMAGAVDDDTLTQFYAARLVIPRVAPEELARIPASVLRRIPADMAAEFRVVPIASDGELNLTLAMSDPADRHVVDEVAFFTGTYVVRAVATQLQIAWCLAHYYGVMTPLARARLVGEGEPASAGAHGQLARASTPLIAGGTPWEVEDEEETGPARMPIMRRKPVRRRTSELAPRSGTLEVPAPPREPERLPAVVVDDEELSGQREYLETDLDGFEGDTETELDERTAERRPLQDRPILLERPSSHGSASWARAPTGSGEVLLLDQLKNRQRHLSPQTEPGLGQLGSVDSRAQASQDTESRGNPWTENAGENDTVRRQSKADRRGRRSRGQATADPAQPGEATADPLLRAPPGAAAAAGPGGPGDLALEELADPPTDPGEVSTDPMREIDSQRSGASVDDAAGSNPRPGAAGLNVDDGWDVDDGWGPPGSTIPPAYQGAARATDDDEDAAHRLAADPGSAGARAARPSAAAAGGAIAEPDVEIDPAELAAELERSSTRLLETLRRLERAPVRDEVVDLILDHLGGSLRRRAFFAVKGGVLFPFRQQGASRPGIGVAELSLENPSTFGQVALNRIAYRGALSQAASEFVERALGSPGKGEAAVVPVVVRGRAVGLIYGDGPTARLFDEHLAVLGRATGQALERILATRAARS